MGFAFAQVRSICEHILESRAPISEKCLCCRLFPFDSRLECNSPGSCSHEHPRAVDGGEWDRQRSLRPPHSPALQTLSHTASEVELPDAGGGRMSRTIEVRCARK